MPPQRSSTDNSARDDIGPQTSASTPTRAPQPSVGMTESNPLHENSPEAHARTPELYNGATRSAVDHLENASNMAPQPGPATNTTAHVDQSQVPNIENEKVGMDGLLALLDNQFEFFEVTPVATGARKLSTVPDANSLSTRKGPLLLRRKTPISNDAQDTAQHTGRGPNAFDGDIDHLDYEKRYPPDKPGESMKPNARVWRVYNSEAAQFDVDMVEKMRDTVDVILIIAALFAAIVTSLVAITAAALQLDQPKVTNLLLMELIDLQRAGLTNSPIDVIEHYPIHADSSPTETANWTDYTATRLWFASLALSVSAALIAMLVRQWIHSYVAPSFQGTAKGRAEVRHFRFYGFDAWKVPLIIDLLPTLLHLSLFLFFAGLVVFLHPLDSTIMILVAAIASVVFLAYVMTNLLPVWFPSCPYKTPLSTYAFLVIQWSKTGYSWLWNDRPCWLSDRSWKAWFSTRGLTGPTAAQIGRAFRVSLSIVYLPFGLIMRSPWYYLKTPQLERNFPHFCEYLIRPLWSLQCSSPTTSSLKSTETEAIRRDEETLRSRMCIWLLETSSNPSARSIITSLAVIPTELIHVQPPLTSYTEWAKTLQQAITAQVTVTNRRHAGLSEDSFAPYAALTHVDVHRSVVKELLSVHGYFVESCLGYVDDELYNLSSNVDWDKLPETSTAWAGEVCAQRLCLHILSHVMQDSPRDLVTLLNTVDINLLSRLSPAMRVRPSDLVYATPSGLKMLKIWLPTHSQMYILSHTNAHQLQLLLEVATFLLGLSGTEFKDVFKDGDSLSFWRHAFVNHHHLITGDSIQAFQRMMHNYAISRNRYLDLPQAHLPHVFSHLDTICTWEAVRRADGLPEHIESFIREDPWNHAWQKVIDDLPASLLLPTYTEATKEDGAVFVKRLNDYLLERRAQYPRSDFEEPQSSAPGDVASIPPDALVVHSQPSRVSQRSIEASERPSNNDQEDPNSQNLTSNKIHAPHFNPPHPPSTAPDTTTSTDQPYLIDPPQPSRSQDKPSTSTTISDQPTTTHASDSSAHPPTPQDPPNGSRV